MAGNVGHIQVHSAAARATAAVPPLAAAAALAVGLGVLKRVVALHATTSAPAPEPVRSPSPVSAPAPELVHPLALANGHSAPAPAALADAPGRGYSVPDACQDAAGLFTIELAAGQVPSVREIRRVMHLGQPRAQQVHAHLTALAART